MSGGHCVLLLGSFSLKLKSYFYVSDDKQNFFLTNYCDRLLSLARSMLNFYLESCY